MPLSHPRTITPTLVGGKTVFHETGLWCQKDWGLLLYKRLQQTCWTSRGDTVTVTRVRKQTCLVSQRETHVSLSGLSAIQTSLETHLEQTPLPLLTRLRNAGDPRKTVSQEVRKTCR